MLVVKVVLVTTPDHMVDHKWSVGVPRLGSQIWISKGVIFQGEQIGGGAGSGADHDIGDH